MRELAPSDPRSLRSPARARCTARSRSPDRRSTSAATAFDATGLGAEHEASRATEIAAKTQRLDGRHHQLLRRIGGPLDSFDGARIRGRSGDRQREPRRFHRIDRRGLPHLVGAPGTFDDGGFDVAIRPGRGRRGARERRQRLGEAALGDSRERGDRPRSRAAPHERGEPSR